MENIKLNNSRVIDIKSHVSAIVYPRMEEYVRIDVYLAKTVKIIYF